MNRKSGLRIFLLSLALPIAITGCKDVDDLPPAIIVNGANPANVIEGNNYTDAGATAYDVTDGNVAVTKSGEVDTQTPGKYTITYFASDKAGNKSKSERIVIVEPGNTKPGDGNGNGNGVNAESPVITITGSMRVQVAINTAYIDEGATANDAADGELTVNTEGQVNTSVDGTYVITYTATDKDGNTAMEIRTVQVADSNLPDTSIVTIDDKPRVVGKVYVPLGDGSRGSFNLHVMNVPARGKTAVQIFAETKKRWQDMYQGFIDKGLHSNEIKRMLSAISNDNKRSGVYVNDKIGACGYGGNPGLIACLVDAGFGMISHESMHGWNYQLAQGESKQDEYIWFLDMFYQWTNWVYHARQNTPEKIKGSNWELPELAYGLLNNAEWLAEVFAGYMGWGGGHGAPIWSTMQNSNPEYAQLFDCLWKEGKGIRECSQFAPTTIKHQQYIPSEREQFPSIPEFSNEDSKAIWKVCANASDKANYTNQFNAIIDRVAPNLPGSSASHYKMSTGDCNHDGTMDWVCTYNGPGPNGKNYPEEGSREATYSFILGGKVGDSYAEYVKDPYLTKSLGLNVNRLVQPHRLVWQGEYGSCNGVWRFKWADDGMLKKYLGDSYIPGLNR